MARKAKQTEPDVGHEAKRKVRTREHVLADLSVHHVEGMVLKCGYSVQRTWSDYGYDLWLQTYNEAGEIEDEHAWLQLKASDSLDRYELTRQDCFSFPVTTKDYRLWSRAILPVFLILYDARLGEAYWLDVQDHAATTPTEPEGKYLRVRIPHHQILGVQKIRWMRQRKNARVEQARARQGRTN